MEYKKDVCIIGGGVIGLSTAYYLAKSGKSVVVLEMNDVGNGASATCDDMVMMQSKLPGVNLTLAIDGLEYFHGLPDELQTDVGYAPCGGMILIENQAQLTAMERFVTNQQKAGLNVTIVGRDVIDEKQPYVAKDIIASTYCPWDAQINPLMLLRGFVRGGLRYGVEIRRHAKVNRIEQRSGHWEVGTEDGTAVNSETVVLATGSWAPQLGKLLGLDLPITPRRGQLVITEQIPVIGQTHLWSASYLASKVDPTLLPNRTEYEKKIGLGFAFSRTKEGNHVIGSTREQAGYDKSTVVNAFAAILKQARRFVPILSEANVIRTISGFRPACKDGKPIVGPIDSLPGFFVAAGHEGDGISLAPITGVNVAAMITGAPVDRRFDELNYSRFTANRMES